MIITKNTRLDLYLVVETMRERRRIDYGRDGVRAMEALRTFDQQPLTCSVHLFNRVLDPDTREVRDILVYQSVDTLPRWVTRAGRERALEAHRAEEARKVVPLFPAPQVQE